jgi:hypothetical protein
MSVHIIINDKNHFKTKGAIDRFKKAVKLKKEINASDFLEDGFNYQLKKINNEKIEVEIVTQEEYLKLERRKDLKMKLRNAQYSRSNQPKKKIDSLKRSVPDNIFKAYMNIIRKYQFNIPAPDEVINDLEKYRLQVSLLMNTNQKISNDTKANNLVKKYFKSLGEFCGIEPMNIPTQLPEAKETNQQVLDTGEGAETEEEDEDVLPELINA